MGTSTLPFLNDTSVLAQKDTKKNVYKDKLTNTTYMKERTQQNVYQYIYV